MTLESEEYFYNDQITIVYLVMTNVLTALTVTVAPFYFYIVWTQSKALGKFKYLILNHSFWSLCLEMTFFVNKPVLLMPAACSYLAGFLGNTNHYASAANLILLFLFAIFHIFGVTTTLTYRFFGIDHGKIGRFWRSKMPLVIFIAIHVVFISVLGFYGRQFALTPREVFVQQALDYSPGLSRFIVEQKTFIYVDKSIHNVPSQLAMGVLVLFTLTFVLAIVLMKRELTLAKMKNSHLIASCISQVTIIIFFQFLPFFFIFAAIKFDIPYAGPVTQGLEILIIMQTLVDYCATLYFVLPYRRFVRRCINRISCFGKLKTNNSLVLPVPSTVSHRSIFASH